MLSTSVPALQGDILQSVQSASQKAAYIAMVAIFGDHPTEDTDAIAQRFADNFSQKFATEIAPTLAKAIMRTKNEIRLILILKLFMKTPRFIV